MSLPDQSQDLEPISVNLRTVLMLVSVLLCIYAALRLLNLTLSILEEGMIPQLWWPVFSISTEVGLLLLCLCLLAVRKAFVWWVGLFHAGAWLIVLLFSLPVHLPFALDKTPIPSGHVTQATISQNLLVFQFGMLVVTTLLAWGFVVYARRLRGAP
jgi:hypothetical protein